MSPLCPPITLSPALLFLNGDFILLLFTVGDAGAITVRSVEKASMKRVSVVICFYGTFLCAGKALNHTLILLDKVIDKMGI